MMLFVEGLKVRVLKSICLQISTQGLVVICDLCPFEVTVSSCYCDFVPLTTHPNTMLTIVFSFPFFPQKVLKARETSLYRHVTRLSSFKHYPPYRDVPDQITLNPDQ